VWGIVLNNLAYYLISPIKKTHNFVNCHFSNQLLSFATYFITTITLSMLFNLTNLNYWIPSFIFVSALIITIRTDLETMLISRFASLFLVPIGFLSSYFGMIPISLKDSLLGFICGYGILFVVSKIFYFFRKQEGIGQGDLELLGFIGAFLGILGCWFSLFFGSILGSFVGIGYIIHRRKIAALKIPFGPFLALGAILYLLFKQQILCIMVAA
jgi:leader peptidase (prepilin peptidase) / N-methyltransferase